MVPLIVLVASFVIFDGMGIAGIQLFAPWTAALRSALVVMFLLTASSHFTKSRFDLVRMVPPAFPNPELLVRLTGLLQVAGAVGLLLTATRLAAAVGLIALLLALLPANSYAVREHLTLNGKPVTPFVPRLAIQVVFILSIVLQAR